MRKLFTFLMILISLNAESQHTVIAGRTLNERQFQLPFNRLVQPAGQQIVFGDESRENHSMDIALSPDGKWLAVEERFSIVFINTADNTVKFTLLNNMHRELTGSRNTYSGILWNSENNNTKVYWSAVGSSNRSFVVSAIWNGAKAEFDRIYEYKAAKHAETALPNEILISRESNKDYLYVVLNGNDQVIKQDLLTGDTIWTSYPGVAPYGIVRASGKIYVTNWAGRYPDENDSEIAGIPWSAARVDNKAGGSTREGSVAVIDPLTGLVIKDIIVGLHPNEIISDKKGRYIYVTNSNSDNVSVINTISDRVTETISVRLQPEINPYFGDSPNGLCLSHDQSVLYVANGMDNALAVISLGKKAGRKSKLKVSAVNGFIPTGAYPSGINISPAGIIYVGNIEGNGIHIGQKNPRGNNLIYNSHYMYASVSAIPVPAMKELEAYTDTVIALNDLSRAILAREKPGENISPKPVPDRIGEPSLFKHVLYIIKENRTYDQLLGDMKEGRGDPSLCIYNETVTPNTHKLCREFLLLDNFYVSGKCSAEGHQWTDASIVTDYIEKNMYAWFRSYPHVQEDALVYAPTGFIWDNAMKHGKNVRIYGEAASPYFKESGVTWTDVYRRYSNGEKVEFENHTTLEPVKKILSPTYPSYGPHVFTDIMRADDFIKELEKYEAMEGDQLPELMIMALPNDHTAGTRPGYPTPRAMVADNDLALGRIVEAMTRSKFWKNTVILVVEDDSQGGWDHVSAYRTMALVISPYSRLRKTISTHYTQPSMIRTIEQILGLPPMNIQDAVANPMNDCFSDKPDLSAYVCVPNNIPLDEMNKPLSSLSGRELHFARKSMLPVFDRVDTGNDDLLNRILWHAAKGNIPYPARYAGASGSSEEETDGVESGK